ncbi:hypothetical protein [Candidatus Shikimatogenerans silvanidophilus]|uniref:hypothetical protein n=1 Tax=Candidatus Shikimatogenerans silvanidophilus TaxID=2782547 RepID=UPI0021D41A3B|nr:hypothetical protein [Candidatus Shikimatogenerans silvanidophilus]
MCIYIFKNKKKKLYIKIYKAKAIFEKHNKKIGIFFIYKTKIKIYNKEGFISILEAQIEGKKKMKVKYIINGLKNM